MGQPVNFEELADPLVEMDRFREQAERQGLSLPESMTLSTIGLDGAPRARVVLLRGRRGRELHFFTNYESDKSLEMARDPRVSACIHYPSLALQTRVEGIARRLSADESDAYFASRPRDRQLGAWASQQSRPLVHRDDLERKYAEAEQRFLGRDVPRPPYWGGFCLEAHRVELWIGKDGRLHDRARYEWTGSAWSCVRLQP